MSVVTMVIGAVLIFEGLVLALAPSRIEDMMRLVAQMPIETRRLLGLAALATGVFILWVARLLGL